MVSTEPADGCRYALRHGPRKKNVDLRHLFLLELPGFIHTEPINGRVLVSYIDNGDAGCPGIAPFNTEKAAMMFPIVFLPVFLLWYCVQYLCRGLGGVRLARVPFA